MGISLNKPIAAFWRAGVVTCLLSMMAIGSMGAASAMDIQVVKSRSGVEAWLVQDRSVPLMAMRFAFKGGSSQDPEDKAGVANFLSTMLDEGAGPYDAATFQQMLEDTAAKLSFSETRDYFSVSFQTLSENRDDAIALLKLALTKPRFDDDAIERMRGQLLSRLAFDAKSPNRVAGLTWSRVAYADHPYGRPASGTVDTIKSVTAADLEQYRGRVFARDNLKVAVVGDIDPDTLAKLLDDLFGDLPEKADLAPLPEAKFSPGQVKVVKMPVPQSVAIFGLPGIKRDDPDFMAAFVMNQILGGGGFASRLMEEVREKRGLAYSVYSYLQTLEHGDILAGGVATKNERMDESLEVIKSVLRDLAENGPSPTELENAKSYLTGSYALRFDTSSKIAQQLLGIQLDDLGLDYITTRNPKIAAVTIEDVRRVAKRLLDIDKLIVTVVGQPTGIPG